MARESMVFYASWLDAVRALPKALQGDVLLSMLEYGIEGKTVCKQGSVAMAMLAMVKPIIDANNKRYESGCKGGRPKVEPRVEQKPNGNQTETKQKPNGNQTKTYNDNDNDNVNDNEEEDIPSPAPAREELPSGTHIATSELYDVMAGDVAWLTKVANNTRTTAEALRKELKEFCDGVMMAEDTKELTDARRHFIAWRRKRPKEQGRPTDGGRPYKLRTYEQMLAECAKLGCSTDAYVAVRVRGKAKPSWVTATEKEIYQIPDEL